MLDAASGGDEGAPALARKADALQRALHALVRAARLGPDAVVPLEQRRRMPGEGVGGRPLVLQVDPQAPGRERERVVGGVVINVGPEVADDADADGAHGEIVAEGRGSWNRNIAGPAPCSLLLAPCYLLLAP